jgi:hypothetical protein
MEADSASYHFLACLASTASQKKAAYTREQKGAIEREMLRIAEEKYPVPGYVPHAGYRIVAKAQAYRVGERKGGEWQALAKEGRALPNESDVTFVLMTIASCLPSPLRDLKEELFNEVEERIGVLRSTQDRYVRLVDLADTLVGSDTQRARRILRRAAETPALHAEDASLRRLIDLAYRVDPDLAVTLVEAIGTDPARAAARQQAKEQLRMAEIATQVREAKFGSGPGADEAEAAWQALAEVNAGRTPPVQGKQIWALVEKAAALPLQTGYALLALAFASAARQFSGSEHSADLLRSIADGAIVATRVARELASAGRRLRAPRIAVNDSGTGILVPVGERTAAIQWLEQWCADHVRSALTICDPYFGLNDLEALKSVVAVAPDATVQIVTSRHALRDVEYPFTETFRRHWRERVALCEPPVTDVIAVSVGAHGKMVADGICRNQAGHFLQRTWDKRILDFGLGLSRICRNPASAVRVLDATTSHRRAGAG